MNLRRFYNYYYTKRTLKNGVLHLYFFCCVTGCVRGKSTVYDLPKESLLSQCLYRWLTATEGFCNTAYKLPEGSCENTSQPGSLAKDRYCYQDLLNTVLLAHSTYQALLQSVHRKQFQSQHL